MKGLFLKIFGWFWLTIIITISATYWISSQVFNSDNDNPRLSEVLGHYIEEIESKLTKQDLPEFLGWFKNQRFPRGIGVTLVDKHGSIIDTKGIPKKFLHYYQEHKTWPFESNRHFKIEQKSINAAEKILLSVVLFPRKARMDSPQQKPWLSNFNKRTRGWSFFRLLIALCISALVCYFLARYLSKPILKLRNTVNDLGKGNFKTNVAAQFANRNDEISELASDIDDMAAKLREQFERREDLLRDISHELRSPLARMRIASELIKSRTADPSRKEIKQLESDIALIDELIGEILTFSRLIDKNKPPEFEHIDIKELLEDILKNANFEAKSLNKQVILQCKPEANYHLHANEALIQRALENVIRNAIKYTPATTSVRVKLERDSDFINVAITDHGPGVPNEQLEKVFEPFYRVSDSRSRESGGSGLGLAITKRAIELHKGKILAANTSSAGLVITIQLPVLK